MENNLEKDILKKIEQEKFVEKQEESIKDESVAEGGYSEEEKALRDKIEKEKALIGQGDDVAKISIKQSAQNIKNLDAPEKLKQLLNLAKEKGVFYAVEVAKKIEDPYLLDMFHDNLANNEEYKKFLNKE